MNHEPKHRYDCGNCKFNWCCGYSCACSLRDLPEEPEWLKKSLKVIHGLIQENYKLRREKEIV